MRLDVVNVDEGASFTLTLPQRVPQPQRRRRRRETRGRRRRQTTAGGGKKTTTVRVGFSAPTTREC